MVTEQETGRRLDHYLQGRIPELSRTTLRAVIDIGGVHVDGRRVRKNGLIVTAGQSVELHRDEAPLEPFRLDTESIVFQDDYLLAINKPAGVDTQPTPARYQGTLYEAVQVWLGRNRRFGRKLEIGMVQRLDRGTSGLIVFSIHPRAHGPLSEQFRERLVRKRYLALVQGCPAVPCGCFVSHLARNRRRNRMGSTPIGGRPAETRYRVVDTRSEASLLLVELITGRTHQIRAHLSEAGHPLIGDVRYGGPGRYENQNLPYPSLHSWRLSLYHPLSGDRLELVAPVPALMDWPVLDTVAGRLDELLEINS